MYQKKIYCLITSQYYIKGELKYVAGKAVYYFLGIPYAQAPMADLRFEPPQKHPGWQVRNFRKLQVLQSKTYFFREHSFPKFFPLLKYVSVLNF